MGGVGRQALGNDLAQVVAEFVGGPVAALTLRAKGEKDSLVFENGRAVQFFFLFALLIVLDARGEVAPPVRGLAASDGLVQRQAGIADRADGVRAPGEAAREAQRPRTEGLALDGRPRGQHDVESDWALEITEFKLNSVLGIVSRCGEDNALLAIAAWCESALGPGEMCSIT